MTIEPLAILRSLLLKLGLSQEAVEDILERIRDLLAVKETEGKSPELKELPYRLRDDFLSNAERDFYTVLHDVIKDRLLIFTKVSLGDLFYPQSSGDESQFRIYRNKIDRKHVDFLLCDLHTFKPVAGIELDDKSHLRADRQERDKFVEAVFTCVELPLLRFPVQRKFNPEEINQSLEKSLLVLWKGQNCEISVSTNETAIIEQRIESRAIPANNNPPDCPKCGVPMVLRTASKGANAGGKFWGCSNYPRCREIIPFK